jgi:hypothetical protein
LYFTSPFFSSSSFSDIETSSAGGRSLRRVIRGRRGAAVAVGVSR